MYSAFLRPSREASLHAIAKVILAVRSAGITYKEIARAIDVSPDTIEGAAVEKSLLLFDAVARLVYLFPNETRAICELMRPRWINRPRPSASSASNANLKPCAGIVGE